MTAGESPDTPLPIYATSPRPRRVKRVWLATFLASLAACLSVTLIAFILLGISDALFDILGMGGLAVGQKGIVSGLAAGLQLAAYNFFLFFITVPAAALALGLSVGRFPRRGITALKSYMRWGAIWGAILVGGVTFAFGWFGGVAAAFGALLSGGFTGGVAGTFCGFLMHKIINPVRQLSEYDIEIF